MAKKAKRRSGDPQFALVAEKPPAIQLATHKVFADHWGDPWDDRPGAAKVQRTINGYRASDPLRWCRKRFQNRSSFTEEHIIAADRLRAAWDSARLGFSALKDWRPVHSVQYRPSTGPTNAAMRQLRAVRAFGRMWSLFESDVERALVVLVILKNLTLTPAAEMLDIKLALATQTLVAALDRLCKFLEIEPVRRAA
jgi:hypothetical protein